MNPQGGQNPQNPRPSQSGYNGQRPQNLQSGQNPQNQQIGQQPQNQQLRHFSQQPQNMQPAQPRQPIQPQRPTSTPQNMQRPQSVQPQPQRPSDSTYANSPVNTNLKTTDWAGKSPDWTKYHSAWQNYYQKYYSDYYARAAQSYVKNAQSQIENEHGKARENLNAEKTRLEAEKQKLRKSRAGLTAVAIAAESQNPADATAEIEEDFRTRIQKIARTDRKKRARRRKFIPLILGVATVLVLLFLQYNRLIFAPIMAYVSPGNVDGSTITEIDPTISVAVSPDPTLLIPKLNVDVPIVFGIDATDTNAVMSAMNKDGVVHFRIAGASAYPGEFGNLVITGHSAGDVYSNNQYKFIFSGLERLVVDDKIYVDYNGVRYTYSVTETKTIDPKSVAELQIGTDKPRLTLVTCWPLGTSEKRLLVIADQINPTPVIDPAAPAPEATPTPEPTESSEALPENETTFFDGIWSWLTNS